MIRDIRDAGVAMLFVSHFLDQVYAIADRVTILRNGKLVGEYPLAELAAAGDGEEDGRPGAGRARPTSTASRPPTSPSCPTRRCSPRPGSAARARSRRSTSPCTPARCSAWPGCWAPGAPSWPGCCSGPTTPIPAAVTVDDRPTRLRSPIDAIAARIAFCSEDRKGEGIVGDLTVRDNLVLALQARRGWARRLPRRTADELVAKWIAALDIRPTDPDVLIRNLSGGNQQKVLLARWLITEPRLLILDEPTRGIDVGAKTQIQRLVADLAGDGMAVVFISAELEEVLRLSRPGRGAARPAQGRRAAAGRGVDGPGHGADRPGRLRCRLSVWRRFTASSLFWPVVALVALLVFDAVAVPGFFCAADPGRAPLRQPRRHPQERRPHRADRAGHDAGDRHPGHRPLGRRHRRHLRRGGLRLDRRRRPIPTSASAAVVGVLLALGLAVVLGLWNGFLVAVLGIQPIIATLVLMTAGRGIAQLITDGQIITVANPLYAQLGGGFLLGLPVSRGAGRGAVRAGRRRHPAHRARHAHRGRGDQPRPPPGSPASARGASPWPSTSSSRCAPCLAGLMISSNVTAADANNAGLWIELDAILAVVIGGTLLTGGRYSVDRHAGGRAGPADPHHHRLHRGHPAGGHAGVQGTGHHRRLPAAVAEDPRAAAPHAARLRCARRWPRR